MDDLYTVVKQSHVPVTVSVIIPTFRRWDLLCDAIESVFRQSFTDWEIVIVNDGGDQPVGKVNELLKNHKITYVEHLHNKGLPAARNTGLVCSSGEFIAYLDDDDIFYPNHLEVLINALLENCWDVVYADAYKAIYGKEGENYHLITKQLEYSYAFQAELMWRANIIPVINVVHRKDCLKQAGVFDPSLKIMEDWDLWLRMSSYYAFHHIPVVTAEYRVRQDKTNMTQATCNEMWTETKCAIYRKYLHDPKMMENQQVREWLQKSVSRFVRKNYRWLERHSLETCSESVHGEMIRLMILEDWFRMFFKNPLLTIKIGIKMLRRSY